MHKIPRLHHLASACSFQLIILCVSMLHKLSGTDEIDLKMGRGLNLNLEEQALPAGTQCVRTLVIGSYATKKVVSPPSAAFMAFSTPKIPSFVELCIVLPWFGSVFFSDFSLQRMQ